MDLVDFFIRNRAEVLALTLEHLFLVAVATGAAAVVGIPIGILLTRRPRLSKTVLAVANILQTIPSLALFGFLIPVLGSYGIGRLPAIIALFLYSLLPIIRNTFTGINGVDPAVREAARGMGMTDWQMLTQVELPLASSVIIAGLRVATVISVGTATIAAAIGAGGLGTYIFRGLRSIDRTLILAGAIPAAVMALGADFALGWVERSMTPGASRTGKATVIGLATGAALVLVTALILSGGNAASNGAQAVSNGTRPIVIGSKDFTESRILAELMAQTIEAKTGIQVKRQFELSGDVCHRALVSGELDGYAEYTGTAFTQILKHAPITDAREVYDQVKREYESQFNLEWLAPLGFQNTFAILVRRSDAARLNLKTVSDAAPHAPKWRAGFGQDFMSREDGYPGFSRAYGLRFVEPPREMDLSLTYQALANGQVDLIAGNSTDGLIEKLGLVQLEDDRHYFPPYEAAPVFRKDTFARNPEIRAALEGLAGKLSDVDMRRLNYGVDGEKRDVKEVVRDFLARSREQGAGSREHRSDSTALPVACSVLPAPCSLLRDLLFYCGSFQSSLQRMRPMETRYNSLLVVRDSPTAIVIMNRPERRNALSLELMEELIDCLSELGRSPDVRAVILAGAGPAFSAGHDLGELAGSNIGSYRRVFDICTRLMSLIQEIPQPVIAEVNGIATAAGCQLVATCDLAVASADAKFATPGVRIGLFCTTPMVALTRSIGRKRALEMLMTGVAIDSNTAMEWGLINRVVPGAELRATTYQMAQQISEASPFTVAIGKQAFYAQIDMDQPKAYAYAKEVMTMNAMADDAQEGMEAFIEKRIPCWHGR